MRRSTGRGERWSTPPSRPPGGPTVTDLPVDPPHLFPRTAGSVPAVPRAPEQLGALAPGRTTLLGTSHRQAPVKDLVAQIQERLAEFLGLPAGYEIVLGTGQASVFWDSAAFAWCARAPDWPSASSAPSSRASPTGPRSWNAPWCSRLRGCRRGARIVQDVDVYAWPQNETSTGVAMPVRRVVADDALTVVDATSAGGMAVEIAETDMYYFSPQKNLAATAGSGARRVLPRSA
ncbi:aminotransferase class V-fold PLP-dependent enzyme [Kocuria rhizophila]|nr:aminotransferase class V-fold PLP-dependent enzyme [Kocuria rhizophila]